jgi:cell wall-associated NlpC family hydrolase
MNNKNITIDITKYLGIPYKHGGSDKAGLNCYGLIRLFYAQEFNIELFDYRYDENWDKKGFNYIQKKYRSQWQKIEKPEAYCGVYRSQWQKIEKPEAYCGVGFRLPGHSIEHHLGIILPDLNNFLHSPLNQGSRVESLAHPTWAKAVTGYYRHNDI